MCFIKRLMTVEAFEEEKGIRKPWDIELETKFLIMVVASRLS